jgi:hypothetical protein
MASATTSVNVTCPNCAKVLRLSSRPAKGKKIKCPACGEAFLPDFDDETAIQEKRGEKAKSSSNKSRNESSRDDEDDEDDPPKRRRRYDEDDEEEVAPARKRKKPKKKAGSNMMMIILLLVGGCVLFLGCGVAGLTAFVWPGFMVAKPNDKKVAKNVKENQGIPKEIDKDNGIKPPVFIQDMDPLTFNNNIANVNRRLASAGEPFGRAIGPALARQNVNMVEVHRTLKVVQETLSTVKAETQAWKIPAGANAKNFFDSHQRFLKVQEDGINDFGSIVRVWKIRPCPRNRKPNKPKRFSYKRTGRSGRP